MGDPFRRAYDAKFIGVWDEENIWKCIFVLYIVRFSIEASKQT